jgi:hypothetical protein
MRATLRSHCAKNTAVTSSRAVPAAWYTPIVNEKHPQRLAQWLWEVVLIHVHVQEVDAGMEPNECDTRVTSCQPLPMSVRQEPPSAQRHTGSGVYERVRRMNSRLLVRSWPRVFHVLLALLTEAGHDGADGTDGVRKC